MVGFSGPVCRIATFLPVFGLLCLFSCAPPRLWLMLSVFFFPGYFVLWQFWTPSCPCWQENTVLSLVFVVQRLLNTVFLFWWSGDCHAPSAARKHGFHSVGVWLQRLSWIKSVRCVWQTGDFVDGSELAFSMDKLHHKDTVLVWDVSEARLPLLLPGRPCKSLECVGPLSVCALVLSRLCFICLSDCTSGYVSLCPCI